MSSGKPEIIISKLCKVYYRDQVLDPLSQEGGHESKQVDYRLYWINPISDSPKHLLTDYRGVFEVLQLADPSFRPIEEKKSSVANPLKVELVGLHMEIFGNAYFRYLRHLYEKGHRFVNNPKFWSLEIESALEYLPRVDWPDVWNVIGSYNKAIGEARLLGSFREYTTGRASEKVHYRPLVTRDTARNLSFNIGSLDDIKTLVVQARASSAIADMVAIRLLANPWDLSPIRERFVDRFVERMGGPHNTEGRLLVYDLICRLYDDAFDYLAMFNVQFQTS